MSEQNPFATATTADRVDDEVDAAAWGREEDDDQETATAAAPAVEAPDDQDGEPQVDDQQVAGAVAPAPAAVEDDAPDVDPVADFNAQMSRAPGDWYVVHT